MEVLFQEKDAANEEDANHSNSRILPL